jgi:hypothetical protein
MGRIIDPYARLFKLVRPTFDLRLPTASPAPDGAVGAQDNPIAHQGCGPGMYSQLGSRGDTAGPLLDVDVFGIPAAFLHGLFAYQYFDDHMVIEPSLPDGVSSLTQEFPIRFGNLSLFFSLSGTAPPPSPPAPAPAPPANQSSWSCKLFDCECQKCADYYGIVSGTGFGCAPLEAQHWWAKQGGKCGGGTKASTGLCSGPGCKAQVQPCPCPKNQSSFTCQKCSDGGTTCPLTPETPTAPPVKYEWWQIPTRVTIDSKPCASCLSTASKASRKVSLPFDLLSTAAATGASVAVHVSFGAAAAAPEAADEARGQAQARLTGVEASQHWRQKQHAKSSVSLELAPPECVPPAEVQAFLANSTAFSAAMAKSGLGERFEAAQSAAFREALNASVTRCTGRASGAIPNIPKQPTAWNKYNMGYNQTKAEGYFTDQYMRVWNGLSNLMAAYADPASGLASATHQKIASLFRGEGVERAGRAISDCHPSRRGPLKIEPRYR